MTAKRYTSIDAFYLLMQILTTVGYGDIAPHADAGRVFTACYVLSTVLLMSATGMGGVELRVVWGDHFTWRSGCFWAGCSMEFWVL